MKLNRSFKTESAGEMSLNNGIILSVIGYEDLKKYKLFIINTFSVINNSTV